MATAFRDNAVQCGDVIDTNNGDQVLSFAYEYLEQRALPPSDETVHTILFAVAQCAGRLVARAEIEALFRTSTPADSRP